MIVTILLIGCSEQSHVNPLLATEEEVTEAIVPLNDTIVVQTETSMKKIVLDSSGFAWAYYTDLMISTSYMKNHNIAVYETQLNGMWTQSADSVFIEWYEREEHLGTGVFYQDNRYGNDTLFLNEL